MVYFYRAAVYVVMIVVALLFYWLLRRFFSSRPRMGPLVVALVTATGLVFCAHSFLSNPILVRKHAKFLQIKNMKRHISMVYMQSECWVCDLDGSNDRQFMASDFITTRDITWSPDGSRILVSRVRISADGMNLFTYDAIGGDQYQVTEGAGISRRGSWSPDGTRIVFDFRPNLRQLHTTICVINADGTGRRELTSGEAIRGYHPVWSPDGASIYFCLKVASRRGDLWVMDADGGNLRQLTFTPDQAETEPAISPDGATIALSINRRHIYLMNADGNRLRPLTTEDGEVCHGRDPSWSPDGQRLYYAAFVGEGARKSIREIGVDGSGLRDLPLRKGKFLNPMLHPDGTSLTYLRSIKRVTRSGVAGKGVMRGNTGMLGGEEDED